MTKKRSTALRPADCLLIVLSVVSLYPVWFIVQTALKTDASYTLNPTGLPSKPTLRTSSTCSR